MTSTRDVLLWQLNQLDREVGISFDSDFDFALAALLYKGVYKGVLKRWDLAFFNSRLTMMFLFLQVFHILCQPSEPAPRNC